jgi:hypothetical protein
MATSSRSKSLVVAVGGPHTDLKHAQALLATVLGKGGCPNCYSGFDIHFVNEVEFFAHNVKINATDIQAHG